MMVTTSLPSFGCAPGFNQAFFSYSIHPDFPLTKFAQGQLGILEPSYARSYQVVAYRYLVGKPLSQSEQRACVSLWRARLLREDADNYGYNSDAVKAWLKARQQVTAAAVPEINTYRKASDSPDSYSQFENCPNATFQNAIKTLNERITKYGAKSDYVKDWLSGQDKVFCHCGSPAYDYTTKVTAPEGPFPGELPLSADAQLKADRAYQLAAAHFYAKHYDTAEGEFLAISRDANSPWQNKGLFMAVRCLIRKGTLPDKVDSESLSKASELLNQTLSDPKLSSLHDTAQGLLSFIRCRNTPEAKLMELARDVVDPSKSDAFRQNLCDYTFLIDTYFPEPNSDSDQTAKDKAMVMPDVLKRDDLSDWLFAFQNKYGSKAHALERWQATHSLPWLIAALNKAEPGDKEDKELLSAARSIESSSPAFLTLSYYAIDLLMKSNQKDEAARELARVMAVKTPPSAHNDLVNFQMMLTPTVAEFVRLSVQKPVGFFSDYTGMEFPDDGEKLISAPNYSVATETCYVNNAAEILNSDVPLKLLKEAVLKSTAPANARFDLAQAVWIRAVLLKQDAIALSLLPLLKTLKPKLASLFAAYANAKSPADRQFAASVFILNNPGARPYVTGGAPREVDYGRIEDYGDNWWGAKGMVGDAHYDGPESAPKPRLRPQFLTAADVAIATTEVKSLKALGDAPNILSADVLAYAQSHPTDARVPEALSRCVKATRFGTRNAKTGTFSKQAFRLLHQRYGGTKWAAQTPYFYGGG
jgi:hypothetical protein